ncbi:conserved hypothetical protein [Beggiatoa sp. PS]|nr:conserved hypothetical protein [Beggiatoa sp. PS]
MNLQNIIHQHKITRERFSQLVDAYGGDTKRWPIEKQAAALKLLEESVEARHLQHSASNLDRLLDSVPISHQRLCYDNAFLHKLSVIRSRPKMLGSGLFIG